MCRIAIAIRRVDRGAIVGFELSPGLKHGGFCMDVATWSEDTLRNACGMIFSIP
jgi:hypothetical protein